MSAREIAAVAATLFQLADAVRLLGDNNYKASAAWNAFPTQVKLLRAKYEHLEEQLERFGQIQLPSVLPALEEAKKLMLEEVDTLHKRKAREETSGLVSFLFTLQLGRLGEMVFPAKVGLAIQNATQAYDSIVNHLKEKPEIERALRDTWITQRCDPQSSRNYGEDHYVPLRESELRIYSALEESGTESPTVVLVYGGPGKGKSTLVRHISLTLRKDKSSFAHVFLLECGLGADAEARQIELLQRLGGDDLSVISRPQSDESDGDLKIMRQSLLQTFLQNQRLLIILDDVWEASFLHSFLELSGVGVQYIITSQREDLCKDLSCKYIPIQIQDLELNLAKKMLAVHAGIPKQIIPDNFQNVAEKILAQAQGIPLVIAQLGAQLGKAENDDLEVWESVADNFLQCLDETPSKYILGSRYPKSWWAAMRQSCDSLSPKAKQLLCLLSMCKGPSVPESVLQFMYSNAFSAEGCTKYHFSQIKTELKSRQLVSDRGEKLLSIHSLTKKFTLEKMNSLAQSIASCFYGGNSHMQHQAFPSRDREDRVTIVLLCLYLDPDFRQEVVLQTGHPLDTFSASKRATILPITKLLVPEAMCGKKHMATEARTSAVQVLLEFICNNMLLHDSISDLLRCRVWMMPTLMFLQQLSFLGGSFWQTNTLQNIPSWLIHIFHPHTEFHVLIQAASTLRSLSRCCDQNIEHIIDTPDVLKHLTESLCQVHHPNLQCVAAEELANLASYKVDITSKSKIVNFPKVLDNLVQSIAEDQNPGLQSLAAFALRNLADTQDPGILDKMKTLPNLLHKLGELLAKDYKPDHDLQVHAAVALANLSWGNDTARESNIVNATQLLERLVQSLTQDQHSGPQSQVARNLVSLGNIGDDAILDNLVCKLGDLLMTVHKHNVQEQAARVLARLGSQGGDALRRKILNYPNLLEKLVYSIAQDHNLGLQANAADALRSLANTFDTAILDKMANFPDLLHRLGESLAKGNNFLQLHAVGTIANLGRGKYSARKNEIVNIPRLLERLIQFTVQDQNFGLQKEAARALGRLGSTDNTTIPNDLLDRLGKSLVTVHNDKLQEQAATVLACLGNGEGDALRRKIVDFPHLLNTLLDCLAQRYKSGLQENAAKALRGLTATEDTIILYKMANFPWFLHRLGRSLAKTTNPLVQKYIASTIGNLGWGKDKAQKKRS